MKPGMVTDSLGHLGFDRMLETAAKLGVRGLEFDAASWTSAPHMNVMPADPGEYRPRVFLRSCALK